MILVNIENFMGTGPITSRPSPAVKTDGSLSVNTYDKARFTFGFLQYAAHEPNGDFVKSLRLVLVSPEAGDYFPDLNIVFGRVSSILCYIPGCRLPDHPGLPG